MFGVGLVVVIGLGSMSGCASVSDEAPTTPAPVATPTEPEPMDPQVAPTFESLWDGARQDSTNPAGRAWESVNNPSLERALDAAFAQCGQNTSTGLPAVQEDLYFVLVMTTDGQVGATASRPASKVVDCIRTSLAETRFTAPPWDGYRFGIVQLAPRPVAGRSALPASATFAEAFMQSVSDASTVEGQQWIVAHMAEIGAALTPMMQGCPALAQRIMRGEAQLVFEIAADGRTRRVLWDVATNDTECGTSYLTKVELPPPPFDGLWFGMVSSPR